MRSAKPLKAALAVSALACGVWAASDNLPFITEQLNHWAYQKVKKPKIPAVRNRAWVKTPVDAFAMAKLEVAGVEPAPAADKITLLRRATFDLTGLPPTPEEVDAFLADNSARAFEKVIDRLLGSPHYGEKWARHWLDLARYAESEGFKADETRPNAWRYRDYVIKAFNEDKPYDRFIKEQIAGDELWPDESDALVATGFNRHYPDEYNARNLRQRRQEILNDITDTVGAVFLGSTIGCARCHDHKYDPILHKDYYRLQAFFAATRSKDDYVLVPELEQAEHRRKLAFWQERTKDIREQIARIEAPVAKAIYDDSFDKYPDEIKLAITSPPEKRDTMQWLMFHKAQWQLNYGVDEDGNGVAQKLKGEQKKQWEALRKQLAAFDDIKPKPLPIASGITDVGAEAPTTHVLNGGGYDAFGEEVRPGFLTIFDRGDAKIIPSKINTTGRRTALANWLADPANPLTARVMVNRIWHYHFGRGIVGTTSDFGAMRDRETHRELLDWLAATFVEQGWSVKKTHRLIMLSNVYQQSSAFNAEAAKVDPDSKLLWRFRRQRLTGEEIRDAILAVSGRINWQMGGPSVFPEIPKEMDVRGGWKRNESEDQKNRRSIYAFVRRNSRYPMFHAFDMPDTHESCSRRSVTTTAPQALNLLNDKTILLSAQSFAGRVLKEAGADVSAQIETAYRLGFSRKPDANEIKMAMGFLQQQAVLIKARIESKQPVALPPNCPVEIDPARAAALVDFCHALFNSNEFIYVN
ncbi:MAG TPA: DUF1549 and DUF1553 domain-containing protein [Blastocatellia bacterium]|nr:DUF1549 and DUF1553 domain-containing protein [Blastocatellia bacterium]